MPTQLVERARSGGLRGVGGRGFGPSDGGALPAREPAPVSNGLIGVAAFVTAVIMLFLAFTSAYVVPAPGGRMAGARHPRRALAQHGRAPRQQRDAGVGTAAHPARGRGGAAPRRRSDRGARAFVFVIGQIVAWRQFAAQGIFLTTNPHSSFFYVLTSVHGLHLLGGIARARGRRGADMAGPVHRGAPRRHHQLRGVLALPGSAVGLPVRAPVLGLTRDRRDPPSRGRR